jgi:hypothetical protein
VRRGRTRGAVRQQEPVRDGRDAWPVRCIHPGDAGSILLVGHETGIRQQPEEKGIVVPGEDNDDVDSPCIDRFERPAQTDASGTLEAPGTTIGSHPHARGPQSVITTAATGPSSSTQKL